MAKPISIALLTTTVVTTTATTTSHQSPTTASAEVQSNIATNDYALTIYDAKGNVVNGGVAL